MGEKTREPLNCWQAVAGLRPLPPASANCQASAEEVAGCQLWGSNSLNRVMECAGIRDSTSLNQANGSTPHLLQEATKLRSTAAVLPPLSLPKNVQLPRPSAMSRLARSVAPLSISNSPSSRKRVSASH